LRHSTGESLGLVSSTPKGKSLRLNLENFSKASQSPESQTGSGDGHP
jgi:hypothetical protein